MMIKNSLKHNKSGYFRVIKHKAKTKQGFVYSYRYYKTITRKRVEITSIDINKLKEKVKAKNLPWFTIEELEEFLYTRVRI